MTEHDCQALARQARDAMKRASELRVAAAWSDHDAYALSVRGLARRARGLESQADRMRAEAELCERWSRQAEQRAELDAAALGVIL